MSPFIDTTQVPLEPPTRARLVLRMVVVLLVATLGAGMIGGLVALFSGEPDPAQPADSGQVPEALLMGLVVGLAAFFVVLVPAVITVAIARDWMALRDRNARVVVLTSWAVVVGAILATLGTGLGKDASQGLSLIWPSLLWTLLVVGILAPWMVWGRLRRPTGEPGR